MNSCKQHYVCCYFKALTPGGSLHHCSLLTLQEEHYVQVPPYLADNNSTFLFTELIHGPHKKEQTCSVYLQTDVFPLNVTLSISALSSLI
jgi:hypothetical protein